MGIKISTIEGEENYEVIRARKENILRQGILRD